MKKTLYQKYCDGDRLTNDEVLLGIEQFTEAYTATWKLGPEFRVNAKEFVKMAINFTDIARARKLIKE